MSRYALGYRHTEDDRDWPLSTAPTRPAADAPAKGHQYWHGGWWGDQNWMYSVRDQNWAPRPWCVSCGSLRLVEILGRPGIPDPWTVEAFMRECEDHDEWTGNVDEGSSGRASMKVLKDRGVIGEYRRAENIDQIVEWVLHRGPMGVGTPWRSEMFDPDDTGFVRARGSDEGGHWWVISGVNVDRGLARGDNSWGRRWGLRGRLWIPLEDVDDLVFRSRGNAWAPVPAMFTAQPT